MTRKVPALYLCEITAYDPGISGTRVLRYASGNGYTTGSGATPPNAFYDARISQPVDVTRNLFTGGNTTGASRMGIGDLILLNGDGALDALLKYSFDGWTVTVYRSTVLNPQYPADFTKSFVGTMSYVEFDSTIITIKLRDQLATLALPFQTNKYGGTNALPAGVDGVPTDLQGKVKPLCYGQVTNIAPPCVNTSKLIYQVNDGAVNSVDMVYDRGIPLAIGRTLNLSASMAGGTYLGIAFANGQFVATGKGSNSTSPDGQTWTARTQSGGGTLQRRTCAFGNGLFIAAGDGSYLETSPDGITWTVRTTSFGANAINALVYGGSLWVAVGVAGNLETSPDGITWTSRTSGFGATNINGVGYFNGVWIAVGDGGTIARSINGTTWTLQTSGVTTQLNGIYAAPAFFVVLGAAGTLLESFDGQVWTARDPGTTNDLSCGAYGDGLHMLGSFQSMVIESPDGVVWSARRGFATFNAAFGNHCFAFAQSGDVLTTTQAAQTYASLTDLQDDTQAPAPGTYKVYLAGGYFRLGSSPAGTITADVTQGATAGVRTAAQLYTQILTRAGYSSANWSTSDVTALDTANSAVLGLYQDTDTTFLTVIDLIANSVGAWWGPDLTALFRIQQLTAPSGSPIASFTPNDFLKPLAIVTTTDPGNGLPVYRCTLRWGQAYTVQTTDLAGGVSPDRRAVVAQQWRTVVASDLTVLTSDPLALETIEDSLLTTLADATAEAARRLALRKVQRFRFDALVALTSETLPVDLGTVISITSPRFGLSGGVLFRVLDVVPNAQAGTVLVTAWGRPP